MFEIPIRKFESQIEKEPGKSKKNEIRNLLLNHNEIRSYDEFLEVKKMIKTAICLIDLDFLEILLCQKIELDLNGLIAFKIDKNKKTASLFEIGWNIKSFIIPRTIEYKSEEYLVTSISKLFLQSTKLKRMKPIPHSYIRSIFLPESLTELKEGWCSDTKYLTEIKISPSNDRFIFKDGQFLLGKTDEKSDNFDVLLFARRDIKEVIIPPDIKIISSFAFHVCEELKKVEFHPNSNLETIGNNAFAYTKIEEIFIPPTVKKIGRYAFNINNNNIQKIDIPPDSNLQSFEKCAFPSSIEEIFIPKSVKELKEKWCFKYLKLKKIVVSPLNNRFIFKDDKYLLGKTDNKSDNFDVLLFARRDIEKVVIQSNIKTISPCAFYCCQKISRIEFEPNSKLETIGKCAFYFTMIKEIQIPPTVSKIGKNAFYMCQSLQKIDIPTQLKIIDKNLFNCTKINDIYIPPNVLKICKKSFCYCKELQKIEIPKNSKLHIIEKNAFNLTNFEEIFIPERLVELKEGWCNGINKLRKIIISPLNNSFVYKDEKFLLGKTEEKSDNFDVLLFAQREIEEATIPSNIKIISSFAFQNCEKLKKVEFHPNANLEIIGESAFSFTAIKDIFIPPTVSKICDDAFRKCEHIRSIQISPNSNLQIIGKSAFAYTSIHQFYIPPNVTKILKDSFFFSTVKIIEISDESKLHPIDKSIFSGCFKVIVMIEKRKEK